MSGAQTSTAPNVLFDPLMAGRQQQQTNALAGQQLDLSNANQAQVAQASAGLLSAYPDEASRAAAYPRVVGMLQSQGFAKNAPAEYPGEGVLRSLAATQVPAADLYKLQQSKAALDAVWPNAPASTSSTPTTGTPGRGTDAQGQVPPLATAYGQGGPNNTQVPQDWLPYFQEASQRTGIPADVLIAQMRQESGFNPTLTGTSGEIGPAQVMPSTARSPGAGVAPVDPSMLRDPRTAINFQADYLKSRLPAGTSPSDPVALNRALYGYNGGGDKDYVAHVTRYLPAPGGGGTPGSYQVASAAPTAPPGSTAAPAATPAAPAPDAPWDLPGAPAPDLPPPSIPTAAPAPAPAPGQPQPGAPPGPGPAAQPAPVAAGSPPAIPGRTPPPAPTVTVPPPVPLPPAPPPVDGRYLTAQDYQDLNRMKAGLVTNPNGAQLLQAEIDRRATTNVQRIQNYQAAQEKQRADAIAAQQLQLQGGDAALKAWQAANPTPTTPRFGEGSAVWNADTKQWDAVTGNNMANAVQGHWAVNNTGQQQFFPISPAATQAQSEAKAAGTAAGTATGKLTSELADQGRASAQAIGNIDYGLSQLEKAKAGGINTGYFAPWLSTVGAIAKSIGGDTGAQLLGIDPKAVGNIQTAQKTLAVVSGAILQQVLGPDSQITDAKLQHFIHAQPGIETDPDAVSRVLNWARSQFVYEREQAAQGMKDASASGGVLPANWQANYYDKHGFAPIYNPGTGEMQQPDGSAPPRQPPASVVAAPVNPSARTAGTTYSTPKGPMKWTGTGWVTP